MVQRGERDVSTYESRGRSPGPTVKLQEDTVTAVQKPPPSPPRNMADIVPVCWHESIAAMLPEREWRATRQWLPEVMEGKA